LLHRRVSDENSLENDFLLTLSGDLLYFPLEAPSILAKNRRRDGSVEVLTTRRGIVRKKPSVLRSLALTACAAWLSAVLFVSPIVAAIECRQCCSSAIGSSETATGHAPAQRVSCCGDAVPLKSSQSPERCPNCPKCLSKRPAPATVSNAKGRTFPSLAGVIVPSRLLENLATDRAPIDFGRDIVDKATPPPRILFCTWRE
jgi:hypothetical protein